MKEKESTELKLDSTDLTLLRHLQNDGRISNSKLAEKINLSETPCWRRWKKLEELGYIAEYKTVLDRRKMGFGVVAFMQISFSSHEVELTDNFETFIRNAEWISMCHNITGSVDYLLQLVAKDLDEYSNRITQLRQIQGVSSVQSQISVREIKNTFQLPLS